MKIFLIHSPIDADYSKYQFSQRYRNPSARANSESDNIRASLFELITPTLWPISLGSYLKNLEPKIDITVLDGQIRPLKEIITLLREKNPEMVGVNPTHISYRSSLIISREAKRLGAKVMMGGSYAAAMAREILSNRGPYSKDYCVDAICRLDGEETIYKFIRNEPLNKIPNLVYQTGSGIKFNPVSFLDLNSLPLPNFGLVNLQRYFDEQKKETPRLFRTLRWYSSKGCHWRTVTKSGCLFCPQIFEKYRLKSPARLWSEIDFLQKRYDPAIIWDISDDFLGNSRWLKKFLELSKVRTDWPRLAIYARADRISPWVVSALKKLRVPFVFMGLESGDQSSLNKFGKGCSLATNLKAVKELTSEGIMVIASFVLGAPGETKESLSRTLKFAQQIKKTGLVSIVGSVLRPFPGSTARKLLVKATGKKYLNKDLVNEADLCRDWVKYFCRINFKEIAKFTYELVDLNYTRPGNYDTISRKS